MQYRKDRLAFLGAVLILLSVFLFSLSVSCIPQQGKGLKTIAEMSAQERASWFLGIYNSQDRDFRNMVARPDLTNEQKDILRKKKEIMTRVYPMIKTYNTYVDSGAVPTKAVEDQIVQLINDLTALVVPKLE